MMDEVVPTFYRCLRKRRNLSQTAFAAAAGKKRKAIASWESGQARPTYEDERRLFVVHDFTCHELLEVLGEALAKATGRPIALHFEARESDDPAHPLSLAERRLQENAARLPEKFRQQLRRRILAARARTAQTERENEEVLEDLGVWIETYRSPQRR
jgi:transcriptional regulator with XRE-family HTH domain